MKKSLKLLLTPCLGLAIQAFIQILTGMFYMLFPLCSTAS